jgi:hypothetical protein
MPADLTPQAFVQKWRGDTRKERSVSQEHFIDLCRLIGHETPGENRDGTLVFEAGVGKQKGGQGWADVWKRRHFAWEYKGPRADLDKAYQQLLQYRESLENPPLLVVSDIQTIQIHTNFTNTVKRVISLDLDALLTPRGIETLRAVFNAPDIFRAPQTTEDVTREAAAAFATLATQLRRYGEEPQQLAHFLIRLLFCLFAEDVGLLPNKVFSKLVSTTRARAPLFVQQLGQLFEAMRTGGFFAMEDIPHFNGRLFDDATVLQLDSESMEPSILGTLFERSLDPAKRSQLGAHYTSREVEAKARELAGRRDAASGGQATRLQNELKSLLTGFAGEIQGTRVLDSACGAPRGAMRWRPNDAQASVWSAAVLPAAEADPAGGGSRALARPKPGEHAARGGTPRRPQGCKPEPRYGYARKCCRKHPEGQHAVNHWRWRGSSQIPARSHRRQGKAFLQGANRQWPGEDRASGRLRRLQEQADECAGTAWAVAKRIAS